MTGADTRLAELLGALSLACDVAFGFPPEKVMRSCILSVELGRRHGLAHQELRDVFYVSLLQYAGCTAFAHEEAFYSAGDDIGMRNSLAHAISDPSPAAMSRFVRGVGRGAGVFARTRAVARLLLDASQTAYRHGHAMCEASVHLAGIVGMSGPVRTALAQICERWDGKGHPRRVEGEALALAMRVSHIGDYAEIAHHRDGRAAACALVKKQTGGQFDPALARTFLREADALLAAIEDGSVWDRFLAAEPVPHGRADADRIDDVARAFAEMADLKSVWTLGHSTGVAALADRAAVALSMDAEERRLLRCAAHLHDLGRLSAPNRIWDKPGPLSPSEWELVRLHTYWTERVLSRSPVLGDARHIACSAHERLDGAGYHRSAASAMLGGPARLLAAADMYHALCEPRPHRPAHAPAGAGELLLADVAAGRLDRDAAHAVLDAAGLARRRTRSAWPCGLTDREVEVLRLLSRGGTNKEIAASLGISPRTAQHHVIHIYQKIEVSSRAAAALFATENGLLDAIR